MSGLQANILFFLSALGAFNGILLSVYLFTLRKKDLSYLFLAGLLLAVSIRVGKSVLFYFADDLDKLILQVGLSACFFIGPFLFLYLSSAANRLSKQRLSWQVHLGLLALITLSFGVVYPYSQYPEVWGSEVITTIYWSWFVYVVMSIRPFIDISRETSFSMVQIKRGQLLAISVFVGVTAIWAAYFFSSYTSYMSGALSFSFGLYISVLLVVWHIRSNKQNKYVDKKIESSVADALFSQLEAIMVEQQLYRDANLTLSQLAAKMRISASQLSQLLNDNIGKSFSSYVNELRIAEAKVILQQNHRQNMENVAEHCGYNSVSTFYAAFKKIEKIPPAQYRKQFV